VAATGTGRRRTGTGSAATGTVGGPPRPSRRRLASPAVDDRHARHRRADADPRRRPSDGFRTGSAARFQRLVGDALALAPTGLLRYLDDLEIVVDLVPPVEDLGRGVSGDPPPPLAVYEPADRRSGRGGDGGGDGGRDGQPPASTDRVRLYRRPLEARARSASDLKSLVLETVVAELADHHGLGDDDLDELGWG
jgi:predicted Zn-dependent protease with MMP-like domain